MTTDSAKGRRRVVIVQPYVPQYRVPLFARMAADLEAHDCTLSVLSTSRGDPQRGDAASPGFVQHVGSSSWRIPRGPTISRARIDSSTAQADLVVLPLVGTYLENYRVAARRTIALWGHGQSRVQTQNRLDAALEGWLLRRSRRFFAYTESGVPYALRAGLRRDQVTVLNNSVDTVALTRAMDALTPEAVAAFRRRHELADVPVLVILGALDESKRLEMAFTAVDRLHDEGIAFRLLVAGEGPRRPEVEAFVGNRSWAHYLGRVGDAEKAVLSAVGTCMVNPGRVGLIAVDSLALGLPIVTTHWPFHAPEFDYLDESTSVVTADDQASFTAGLRTILCDGALRDRLAAGCRARSSDFTVEATADRFVRGLLSTLDASGH